MPETARDSEINLARLIDDGPVTAFQVRAIILCALVAFLDGLDSQSIAVAAPLIIDKFGLSRSALGPIFSAALFGGMVGALTFGPLGDRFGRKRMLAIAAAIFGVFTFITAHAPSYDTLLAIRFLAGIGLGGAAPCFIALACEYAPQRRRAMIASLIWAAFPVGGTMGGFLNAYILSNYGWETIFLIGGVLPLLTAAILLVWLPESLRFLLARRADHGHIERIVRKIRPDLATSSRFVAGEEQMSGVPVGLLFADGRAIRTVLLWVPFFAAFGILAIVVLWTPALLRDNGIAPTQASAVIAFHGIGAIIGNASAGRLMERFGTGRVLIPAFLLAALATGSLGYAATSVVTMSIAQVVAGILLGASGAGSIALAALTYPTAIRSTGIGWAMGMGRFGQVLTPLAAAAMVSAAWSNQSLFQMMAIVPLVGALAIAVLQSGGFRRSPLAEASASKAA